MDTANSATMLSTPEEVVSSPSSDQPEKAPEQVIQQFSVSSDGTLSQDWSQSNLVPEEFRESKSLKNIKTFQGLVSSLASAQKMIGSDKDNFIFRPGENATPEEKAKYRSQIGVPDDIEGYRESFIQPSTFEGDMVLDEGFLQEAHDAGLTPDQLNWVYDKYGTELKNIKDGQESAYQNSFVEAETSLKSDSKFGGEHFDESIHNARAAYKEALTEFGYDVDGEEASQLQNAIRANAPLMKLMSHFGKNFIESSYKDGNSETAIETLDEQKTNLAMQMQSMDRDDPLFGKLDAKLTELSKLSVNRRKKP